MKKKLRWDNIFKDFVGIVVIVVVLWAVYATSEPIDESKANNLIEKGVVEVATRTDNPVADFHRDDAEKTEALKKLPKCSYCDEPIQDSYLFDIEGTLYCEEHAKELFQKKVEDYIY